MNYNIPVFKGEIPYISTEQMIEVDRLMIEEFGINLFQMMENAGRCLAIVVRGQIDTFKNQRVLVLAGSGGNGGGGLTSARRLYNWGYNVDVLITSHRTKFKGTILNQLKILDQIGINVSEEKDFDFDRKYDIVVDAMIGYSLKGDLRNNIVRLIEWLDRSKPFVVSLDVPSGIDSTTGEMKPVCVKADITMTLALPKLGFRKRCKETGRLLLADISVPPLLYEKGLGIEINSIFMESDIVEIRS